MRYILLFLLVVYISLVYESLADAKPHPQIDPTYQLVIRYTCEGYLRKVVHTDPNRPGVKVTVFTEGDRNPKLEALYMQAIIAGFGFDQEECSE